MKAITLWQPWATFIALGYKKVETRSWPTTYRGPIAIHAAKRRMTHYERERMAYLEARYRLNASYPLGVIVCTATLTDCVRMTDDLIERQGYTELHLGDWRPGRYAWFLRDIKRLDPPVPARGAQGLWEWEPEEEE